MRQFGKIGCNLWHSRKFRSLRPEARLCYIYLHTNPFGSLIGCYRLVPQYAAADLGVDPDEYGELLAEVVGADLAAHDPTEHLIRIVDYLRHDPIRNAKHGAGAIAAACRLPASRLRTQVAIDISQSAFCQGSRDLAALVAGDDPPVGQAPAAASGATRTYGVVRI